jgi:hypothetical protein
MNKQLNIAVCALMSIFAASSIGCSAGFRSGNSSVPTINGAAGGGTTTGGDDQIAKAQAAVTAGQKAMDSASTALSGMTTPTGTIDLSIFMGGLGGGGVLAPIIAKLQPIFDDAYAKVLAVKQQFDASKAAIAAQIAKLDPADPTAVMLTQELTAITNMETQFDTQVHALADRLTLVNTEIDGVIAQATAAIPIPGIGVLAGILIDTFIINDVKKLITDLQTKLIAL